MKAAINNLSVSAILFGILGGIMGMAAGLFLGFALGSSLAAAFHVSTFEGEAGYFAVAIALLVTFIVTPLSILLVLYWRGVRSVWLFIGVGHRLCLDRSNRCIRFRNLVRRAAACFEHQGADAAARI